MEPPAAAQRAHQDPGDRGGHSRHPRSDRSGHQRQRHAAVLARALPGGRARLHGGPGQRASRRACRIGAVVLGGELLPQPHRHRSRPAARRARRARAAGGAHAARQGGHRQRGTRLRGVRGPQRLGPVAGPGRPRCPAAAPAVGLHLHQGSAVQPHQVRRGTRRARHGEHDAARDAQSVPAPRAPGTAPRAPPGRGQRHARGPRAPRRRPGRRRRAARARGRHEVHRAVRQTATMARGQAQRRRPRLGRLFRRAHGGS